MNGRTLKCGIRNDQHLLSQGLSIDPELTQIKCYRS